MQKCSQLQIDPQMSNNNDGSEALKSIEKVESLDL